MKSMIHKLKIDSWKKFTEFIENSVKNYPDVTANYIQYRGQTDSTWKLEPSLLRIVSGDAISEKKANFYEYEAQTNFLSQVHLIDNRITYSDSANPTSVSVDMQHYSCPTRLLDWSESPYVGLYFAVNDNFERSGALFCWDLRFFSANFKELYPGHVEINALNILSINRPDFVTIVFSTRKNERIVKQQGTFSISNNILKSHDEIIIDFANKVKRPSGLYKLEIPGELKLEFLARLKAMNITAESLFPGLDGLGRGIRETLLLRKWKRK